jgi:septum site-determining protein MinD
MRLRRGTVIGVFSAKGGVGKTTVVANLGSAIAQKLKGRVCVVETNMTASNLGLHLNILEPPVAIQDVVFGRVKVDEAIIILKSGLHVLPGSVAFTDELGSIDMKGFVDQLRRKYTVILIDSAPGFGLEVFAGLKACDELLIVCQPEIPAIAGTLQTFRAADRLKIPVLGVVLNRVAHKRHEIPLMEIKKTLGWPAILEVPEDGAVPESITRANPVVLESPESPAANEFKKLASIIITRFRARRRVRVRRAKPRRRTRARKVKPRRRVRARRSR